MANESLTDTVAVPRGAAGSPDVAIVHDYLTQFGGAERVVLALSRTFPKASILTSIYEPARTFPEFNDCHVDTTVLQRIGVLRRHHRAALPFYPYAFGRQHVDADVVICSTSAWAHGVQTDGVKVLYVHNPARWLYQPDDYLGEAPRWLKAVAGTVRRPMRRWDRKAAASADHVLAVSEVVKERIRQSWGIDATVVHPPQAVDPDGTQQSVPDLEPGFLLCVARLRSYKNVDAVVAAMAALPNDRLIVVGGGPLWPQLAAAAPSNVQFLSGLPEAQLRWLYANARLLVAAATEDFGLTPIEALAFGTPSVVMREGGFLETVVDGETGLFFDEATPRKIVSAIRAADREQWSQERLKRHADSFSEPVFAANMRRVVSEVTRRSVDT